ncbi:threonine aspartase 1-like [Phymastichus coffea]|uniref:threonine aspartase 1-like n=1 Tax=Phymastichus coffea TaxID=108790 RepID=UPI00273C5049|nr:threonine aspartase 1-like [Phymastichus coffea]
MSESCKGFIAVHLGAGQHSLHLKDKYLELSKEACEKGIESLHQSYDVLEAVVQAVIVLEDSPITNAGYGSNLTYNGNVECDASVMDGSDLQYGAVGAVTGVKNPVELAKRLCQYQMVDIGNGRVPPSFLVGSGASAWAKEMGIPTIPPENLISVKAQKIYKHYKRKVEKANGDISEITQQLKKRMDTVGAVCVDKDGNIAAACSSGGIILKYPGRVGQAGLWGCGTWASKGEISVGTSTSGCGEHLIRTTLARTIADAIVTTECPTTSLHRAMQADFIDSRLLQHLSEKLGGLIAIRYSHEDGCGDLLWSHSTNSMIIGYKSSTDKSAKSHMSNLPVPEVGKKATVEGVSFKLKN